MAVSTPQWTSRFAFLMAAIGSAVGLGNLWRFPFYTGQNGGAAFVFVYLLCVAFVAYPILMSELAVGRHKGLSAIGSVRGLAADSGASPRWVAVAVIGLTAAFLILTTYSIAAGQVLSYSLMSFMGEFVEGSTQTTSLYAGSGHALIWHTLFMAISLFAVSRGLNQGIERVVTVLMPLFFAMLLLLCIYALATGEASAAISYLFEPDFSALTPAVIFAALGQAFFSIGVGGALMVTYGSFLAKDVDIGSNAAVIAGADTLVAIVSGLMIFPIVFGFSLDPAAGESLIFDAMPMVFAGMPGGAFIGGAFFLLAFIAALTTSIAVLIALAVAGEEKFGINRVLSSGVFGLLVWLAGACAILIAGFAEWVDFLSAGVLMPIGVLLFAVFSGWSVPRSTMREEMHNTREGLFRLWHLTIRYLAPVAVVVILLLGIDARFELGINAFIADE